MEFLGYDISLWIGAIALLITAGLSYYTFIRQKIITWAFTIEKYLKEYEGSIPDKVKPIYDELIDVLEDIQASFADNKLSFLELMHLFNHGKSLYQKFKDLQFKQ
jgi:hypothetical protein